MQSKKIFIHIGAHKTGTTSVQQFFARNRRALIAKGVLYPESCRHHFAQHRLAFALKGKRVPGTDDVPDFSTEIDALAGEIGRADCATAFISSEEFFSLPKAKVALLGDALRGFDVQVLAVLRRPDDLFASLYNQKVKDARNRFALRHVAFLADPAKLSADMRLDEALDHWAETFGVPAMVVHCLEQYPGALSLVAATLGIDLAGLVTDLPRVNVSVSVRTAELVRLGKKAGIPPDRLRRLSDVGGRLFGEAKQAESLLSPQERMQILRGADPMTERIFRRYVCAENIYASERFVETTFAPKTVLDSGDLMRIVDQLLMPGPAPTR